MRMLRTVEGVNRGMIELTCFHETKSAKNRSTRKKSSSCNEKLFFRNFSFWRNVESHPAENVIRRNHQTGKNRNRNRKKYFNTFSFLKYSTLVGGRTSLFSAKALKRGQQKWVELVYFVSCWKGAPSLCSLQNWSMLRFWFTKKVCCSKLSLIHSMVTIILPIFYLVCTSAAT